MKDGIKRAMPFAVSALMIITILIIQFTVISLNDKFDWREFLPQLCINAFLITTTSITWLNAGTDRAKRQEKSPFKDNVVRYGAEIKKVTDSGRLGELRTFCEEKTKEIRKNKETVVLANVGIDRHLYDSTLKDMTKKELKENNIYTRRQIRAIQRVKNGRVRVKAVRAMDLLSDSRTVDDCGVNYNERADKTMRIAFRAWRSILTAIILALLLPEPAKNITDIAAWAMFFIKLCTIVYAAFSSEREGYVRITDTKNKVIMRRIAFLHEFDEWTQVPRLNAGNRRQSLESISASAQVQR